MSKNKSARRSGEAVAAMHRNSAGPMRHRLAPRGNARSRATAEAIDEYEADERMWFDDDTLDFSV